MKRYLLLLLLPLFTLCANADDPVEIDGIYYNLISKAKAAEVTTNPNKYSGEIVLPKSVMYGGAEYSVSSIGANAFYDCSSLTSITIPNSVTSIGESAFQACSALTSLTIPSSVNSIGKDAFMGCDGLTSVNISNIEAWCNISFSNNYSNPLCYAHLYLNGEETKDLVIPNNVTFISQYAFYKCSGLNSVSIPNSVTSIGNYAFYNCSGLTSVTIPNSVTSIGERAFQECSGLTSVTIPNSVTSLGENAFMECSNLTSVHISDVEAWCKISFGNFWSNPVFFAHHLYLNGEEIKDLVIPNSVTSIGKSVFYECYSLNSVIIPNSVTSIGDYAFSGCSALTSVTIPNSVTSIGNDTFSGCSALTSVVIPNSVTSIGQQTFYECSGLTSVTIPNSVTSIGMNAFIRCTGLTSVTIPNSVTSIGMNAFYGCNNLSSITIGSGVTTVINRSFSQCSELTDVYCLAENVPRTSSDAFDGSYIEYATLHVPRGRVDAYKAMAPWSNFKSIVEMVDAKVKLNKTKATIEKGKTLTLKATVTPSNLSDKSVTWKSSDTKVATVTSAGKVKGVKAGTATITCTSNATGAKATCKVTVSYVKLDQTTATIEKGKTLTLTATVYPTSLKDQTVTWKSSKTSVATVTSAGKVKAVKAGTATITCTSNATGLKTTCTVNVVKGTVTLNKTEAYIEKGKTTRLKATLTPTTLTDKSVTWTSSDKSIATVSSSGKVKGVGYGTATITCTSNATGASATCQVTIGKVVISMSDFSLKKTRTTALTATLYPTTLTDKSVTWTSSDKSVATVSSSGKVKGVKAGTATITCTSVATGLKGTCTVTVLAVAESRSAIGDDDGTTGIEDLDEKPAVEEPYDVYDLSGRKVANQVTSLDGLPNGIYIVNGKKVMKK